MLLIRELLRDIKRFKWRSIIVILAISVGISILSLVSNISASMNATEEVIDSRYATHDIIIWFNDFYPLNLIEEVRTINGVKIVEGRIYLYGSTFVNSSTIYITLIGTTPRPAIDTILPSSESIWNYFRGNVCIIDRTMAERAQISLGDNISVYTSAGKFKFRVIDLADISWSITFNYPIQLTLIVPIETLQRILNANEKANVMVLKVASDYSIEDVYGKVIRFLRKKNYVVSGYYKRVVGGNPLEGTVGIIFGIMFLPAALVAGTLLSLVLMNKVASEYRLIGVRKSIGFTPWQVFTLVLAEGFLLYALSIPIAFIMSIVVTYLAIRALLEPFLPYIVIRISFTGFVNSVLVTLILAVIFSAYPAWKAKNVNTLDAIRWGFETIKYKRKKGVSGLPKFVAMAWRNLLRRKKRTSLMILALILSTSASLSIAILYDSIYRTYFISVQNMYKSDAEIFFKEPISIRDINNVKAINGILCAEGYFMYFIPSRNFSLIVNDKKVDVGTLYAPPIVRFLQPNSSLYRPELIEGNWINSPGEIVVSYKVAKYLNLKIGDFIRILYVGSNTKVEINGTIVGIGQMLWQNGWEFIVHINDAYERGLLPKNHFSTLAIKISEEAKLSEIIDKIFNVLADKKPTSVLITKDLMKGFKDFMIAIDNFLKIIVFSTLLVVLVGLTSGFIMVMHERKWDIGLLKSLGGTSSEIAKMFIYETLFMAIIALPFGILIGVIFAHLLCDLINNTSFPLVLFPTIKVATISVHIALPFAITLIAILPVLYIGVKIKPAELLREMF